jgi:hypothetical protein
VCTFVVFSYLLKFYYLKIQCMGLSEQETDQSVMLSCVNLELLLFG